MKDVGDIIETSIKQTQIPGVERVIKVVYQSKQGNGNLRVCSGLVFLPKVKRINPASVAWAHGTIGMGDNLAPSNQKDPGRKIPYLKEFMNQGYVVTATDYAGLGTSGVQNYLIGNDEAEDIINLVRAARKLEEINLSNRCAVVGHSQGGHSALFTGQVAKSKASELDVRCVVAQCPPTFLVDLLEYQKNSVFSWMIGPQIAMAWPNVYKHLDLAELLTPVALKNYTRMALMRTEAAGLEGILRFKLGQKFFKSDPTDNMILRQALMEQTPKPLDNGMPCLIVQGQLDRLVLPDLTRKYVQMTTDKGGNMKYIELRSGTHNGVVSLASETVKRFINDHLG